MSPTMRGRTLALAAALLAGIAGIAYGIDEQLARTSSQAPDPRSLHGDGPQTFDQIQVPGLSGPTTLTIEDSIRGHARLETIREAYSQAGRRIFLASGVRAGDTCVIADFGAKGTVFGCSGPDELARQGMFVGARPVGESLTAAFLAPPGVSTISVNGQQVALNRDRIAVMDAPVGEGNLTITAGGMQEVAMRVS